MSSENHTSDYLILLGLGVWGFFWGFTRLQRKRLIENIPSSTVRSMAMGLVEVIGKARERKRLLNSPLTNTDCVYYHYKIERYQSGRRSGHWVTISDGDSSGVPFYLDDGTGQVLVMPKGAEFIMPEDYKFETGWNSVLPDNLARFMANHSISYGELFGAPRLRFREWYLCPGQEAYVLGVAQKQETVGDRHTDRLLQRLADLKDDPARMKKLDTNLDGDISLEEWDAARERIERELLEEELKANPGGDLDDVMIAKGDVEKTFIISDESQKEVVHSLFWQSILGIYGGAALAVAMLIVFLMDIGVLKY